jgi:SAM-dependent methyltransferase
VNSRVFNAYSLYYDLLYSDKDYVSETSYIQSILSCHGITHGDLLEYGSGTGKHGRILAANGYRVHGIELSVDMVDKAQQGNGFSCQQGDICAVKLERTFDAVLSLFHVVSYQTSNEKVTALFARASEHLKQGGIFVFDFWYSPAVYAQRPCVRIKRMADEKIEITRIAEPSVYPNENRVDVHYTIYARDTASDIVQTMTETHPMRHFSLLEVDLLAAANGFERVHAEEFLTGKPASENSWGVCITLRKIQK